MWTLSIIVVIVILKTNAVIFIYLYICCLFCMLYKPCSAFFSTSCGWNCWFVKCPKKANHRSLFSWSVYNLNSPVVWCFKDNSRYGLQTQSMARLLRRRIVGDKFKWMIGILKTLFTQKTTTENFTNPHPWKISNWSIYLSAPQIVVEYDFELCNEMQLW